jgi:hypothetical protein
MKRLVILFKNKQTKKNRLMTMVGNKHNNLDIRQFFIRNKTDQEIISQQRNAYNFC